MKPSIRKIVTFLEETRTEMGRAVNPPTRRAAAVAVIENPCAGKYVEDLSELMLIGEELGELLTQRAVAALGAAATSVESYGKAAAVGENGELEHAAAILHPDWALQFAKFSERVPRLFRHRRSEAVWVWCWIFRSVTRMPHSSAVISMGWKCESMTLPAPTKSWSQSQ